MKVRFTEPAIAELDEIFAYIARDNPNAAANVVARVEEVARQLGRNPLLGPA